MHESNLRIHLAQQTDKEIEALEMGAPTAPGSPLCRIHAPGSARDGMEIVFKGGQVGGSGYFVSLLRGE
jgi:uncharacterized protein YgbK (DUF1537 family)